MLNRIIAFSIKQKLIIGLFLIGLIGYGSYQFTRLPIDAVPDITDNQVQVITITPSLGAPDVERLITFPIEQANSNIPGLKEIRSFSRFGLSLVTIVFEEDVDVYWARQQVTERLGKAQEQIPAGIGSPELAPVTTGLGEIYQYVLRAAPGYETKYNDIELRTIQDWIIRRQLLGVPGVADVSSFGGKLKQFEIAIDANNLKSYNITMHDVFHALENNNENTGGAYIERKSTVFFIRSEGLLHGLEDIRNIVIKNTANGTPLLIRDVADVRIGSAIRYGAMTYNDEGEVAGAVVMMLKGGNSSEVIKNVKDRIEKIQKTLPKGVILEPFLDRTKMVDNAIGTVSKNLMEGALIVVFVLVLFLGNMRAGLLVASVIPLSMLFAVILMNAFGVSGNLMSLGALDFGLIVDGAVIIVEAVMHSIYKPNMGGKFTQQEMDGAVKHSASRMMNSAIFGQMIILIVYLPIFTLQGIEGKMFKPMAQTVAFALLGAFILSLTYVPMMGALLLSKKHKHKANFSDRMMAFLEKGYQKLLVKALRIPKLILGAALALMALAFFVFSRMGGEFIPTLEEGDFAVETRVLLGSNIQTTTDVCLKAAHILKSQFPEVQKVVGKIGSGEIPTDPMPMEAADLMIILKDKSEWKSAETFDELSEKMSKALEAVPGVTFGFQYPVQMRFNELMSGAKQDVVCKIYGENLDSLAQFAKVLGEKVSKVKGATDVYVETITGSPQIIIDYKRNMVAQFGLNISDINKVINAAFAGYSNGLVFEDEKRFSWVIRLADVHRQSLDDVRNLLIPTPQGTQIPLYQVADVAVKESVNQIQRDDAKRRIIVGFNVRDRDVQSIVKELQTNVEKQMKLPSGYYVTYGGAFENLTSAQKRLGVAVPVSLVLIFFLLYFAFNSVKHGLLIYTAIPLSAIGGILFLALRGMPFSISAGVGFIALFGVAVLNGIVLISEFNRIKKEGDHDVKNIVLQGTKLRLRPVLMTALVASLGFLPMALSHSSGAEVQRPLATVVIGGLLVATLLTLFVLPVLYMLFEAGWKGRSGVSKTAQIIGIILVTGMGFHSVNAQTPIGLQSALDTAIQNNLSAKNARLAAEYADKLQAAKVDFPMAELNGEYGQINSAYKDYKITAGQSMNFPTVYSRQQIVQTENFQSSVLQMYVKEAELKKQVSTVFYEYLYLQQKRQILQRNDSLFTNFIMRSEARFRSGESNILEKTMAETQRGQWKLQLYQVEQDMEMLLLQFQLLLNSSISLVPKPEEWQRLVLSPLDSAAIEKHPGMELLRQNRDIARAITRLEKAKLLPDLRFAYSTMSIQGTGNDNKFYTLSSRFSSVQLGLGIPLFYGAQKSRIQAAAVLEKKLANELENGLQMQRFAYNTAIRKYALHNQVINYYEDTALNQANAIFSASEKQFAQGEINYLEWTTLVNQGIYIYSNYIDALRERNLAIIEINYLNNK